MEAPSLSDFDESSTWIEPLKVRSSNVTIAFKVLFSNRCVGTRRDLWQQRTFTEIVLLSLSKSFTRATGNVLLKREHNAARFEGSCFLQVIVKAGAIDDTLLQSRFVYWFERSVMQQLKW